MLVGAVGKGPVDVDFEEDAVPELPLALADEFPDDCEPLALDGAADEAGVTVIGMATETVCG